MHISAGVRMLSPDLECESRSAWTPHSQVDTVKSGECEKMTLEVRVSTCSCQASHLVGRVADGIHLWDEGQLCKGGAAVDHLVQDAAQAPDIRRTTNLQGGTPKGVRGPALDSLRAHVIEGPNLQWSNVGRVAVGGFFFPMNMIYTNVVR